MPIGVGQWASFVSIFWLKLVTSLLTPVGDTSPTRHRSPVTIRPQVARLCKSPYRWPNFVFPTRHSEPASQATSECRHHYPRVECLAVSAQTRWSLLFRRLYPQT